MLQTKNTRGTLISVTKCHVSPDLSICRSYLSVFPPRQATTIIDNINNNAKAIRFELGTHLRHQLRIIPELKFFLDDSLDYIQHIDTLLQG